MTISPTTTTLERAGCAAGYALGYLLAAPVLFARGIGRGLARLLAELRAQVTNQISMTLEPLAVQTRMDRTQYLRILRATQHDPAWEYFTDNELLAEVVELTAAAGWHLHVTDDEVFLTILGVPGTGAPRSSPLAALTIDSLPFSGPYRSHCMAAGDDTLHDPLRNNARWAQLEGMLGTRRGKCPE